MKKSKHRTKKTILTVVLLLAVTFIQVAECFSLKANAAEEPSVVVSDFPGLYQAIIQARNGDSIGIDDVISISASNVTVGDPDKHITIVRMDAGAFLDIASNHATIQNITFDGNGIAAYYPMCQANYHTDFLNDTFHDCKNAMDGQGGAIRGINGNINLTGCTFTNNEAVNGGHAFFQDDVTLTIQNCTFTGGHASTDGGGLYIQTSQVNSITGCIITGNIADRIGGGILNHSSLSITDSRVYSNTATIGGADIANRSGFNVMVEHDMEALAPLFADLNLLPVEWVNDFDSEAGVNVDGFDPTVANTFLKLIMEEITEDPGEDPDPGTGGGSEDPEDPSGTEPGTGTEDPSGTEDSSENHSGDSGSGSEGQQTEQGETGNSDEGNGSGSGTEQGGTETPSEIATDDQGSGSSESGSNTSTEDNGSNQGSSDASGTASEGNGGSTNTTTDNSSVTGDTSTTTDSNNTSTNSNTSTSSTTDSHDSTSNTSNTSTSSDNSNSSDSHNSTTNADSHSSTSSTDSHNSTSSTDNHSVTNNYYTNPERTSEQAAQQPQLPQVTVVNNIPSSAVQSSEDGQNHQEQNLVQQDNIRIQANGVNVTYEVIDGVHSITINSVQGATPVIQTMSTSEAVPGASAPSEDKLGVNWYEIAKLLLLAGIMVNLMWKRKEKH